jgi:hypothetical protein
MEKPKTVKEAIRMVKEDLLKEKEVYELAVSDPEVFAIRMHHTYGRWIRNEWGLWSGGELHDDLKAKGIHHPDNMSGYILRQAATELKGERFMSNGSSSRTSDRVWLLKR